MESRLLARMQVRFFVEAQRRFPFGSRHQHDLVAASAARLFHRYLQDGCAVASLPVLSKGDDVFDQCVRSKVAAQVLCDV